MGLLLLLGPGVALGEVVLKSRVGGRLENRRSEAKSRQFGRSHLILEFAEVPTGETVRRLAERGLAVVAFAPSTGVVVRVDGEGNFDGLGVVGFDALRMEDKLSAELGRAVDGHYLVEFHRDVADEERRALVGELGMEIRPHRDLTSVHLLVRGTPEQARELAGWDEVAYVFPASAELAGGLPLIGCEGAASESGLVGQATQRVGEGWDGPGLNRADLTYTFQALTRKAPADEVQREIERAMSIWAQTVKVTFSRGALTTGARNINILFGSGDHGDSYPFDGPGRVLAHTFYPAPPNPEPLAGDLHFDDDEEWRVGNDVDVFSVALHELGHALGLGHSDAPGAVMYPYYRRVSALTPEDMAAVRMLYAAADAVDTPTAPIALSVTSPAIPASTTADTIAMTGAVTGSVGAPRVVWQTGSGEGGEGIVSADGLADYLWQAPAVPLRMGENQITATVTDSQMRTASRSIVVVRAAVPEPPAPPVPPTVPPAVPPTEPPPVPPTVPPTNPPAPPTAPPTPPPAPPVPPTPPSNPAAPALTLEVSAPGPNAVVAQSSISASGVSSGGTGQPTVRWASDRGFSGTATVTAASGGGYRWEVLGVSLLSGANGVTFTASDGAGASASKTVQVTYQAAPTGGKTTPTVTIVSPNTTFLMTPTYSVALRGTAKDSTGVTEVRWECTCGSSGAAQGTSSWTVPNVSLVVGSQKIKITARNANGGEGTATLTVFRYEN